jgi:gentisate 1,2-dioxygenase
LDIAGENVMTAAAAKATPKPAHPGLSNKAREMMEAINVEAGKHNVWVRTQANAPAQRPWFSETSGEGSGQLASGRVAAGQIKTLPHLWRWKEYSPYLHQISEIARKADVSPIEFADRQSILLLNPGLNGRLQVTNTIRCAISIYNPQDVAPVHLHSPNASRTILSDKGGYTVVEGERCTASRGDLILTPNGTWHDHGNDDSEPVIWIDTLDWPLMEFLDAAWVDHDMPGAQGNAHVQAVTHSDGYSRKLYGQGGIKPVFVNHQRGVGHAPAPMFHYRGANVLETLHSLRKEKGDPHEGIKVDFVNPVTGEAVFKTLNYSAQLLRPGEETEFKRETAGTYYVVIEGTGATEVGGKRFDWGHNDLFVVPNFLWRRHINTGKTDAVIYSVSDAALMRNIGQYYAQGRSKDGKVTELVH